MRRFLCSCFLGLSVFSLSGCFWGLFGTTVTVVNDTNDLIAVDPERTISTTDMIGFRGSLSPGEERPYSFASFDFEPDLRINYRGHEKIYHAHPDFFGIDVIHVHSEDFPKTSN